MTTAVLVAFAGALVAPTVVKVAGRAGPWALALLPLGLTWYFGSFPLGPEPVRASFAWIPGLDIRFSFALDGLSQLFAVLIGGVGTLVVVYAGAYLHGHPQLGRFYLFLLLFMASMLGLVLADNLVLLFMFWELTSITSFFLIGFDHERATARAGALQALLVTGAGGLALLGGFVLVGIAGGSFELTTLLSGGALTSHPYYVPALLLILAGAFTKSAQVPFHFWLPSAMEAPTPVSAYLHSATMVKAGVYLLMRVSPVLGGTEIWFTLVAGAGMLTMLTGGLLALVETDLKRILAYSTVSALGILTMLIGVGTRTAVEAAAVFLLAHVLYKGGLFFVAGAVDHGAGTRDVRALGGLRRAMPLTAAAALVAGVSLAGFGPVLSFIGKERLLEALLATDRWGLALLLPALAGAACFVAIAGTVAVRPFLGTPSPAARSAHEVPAAMWTPTLGLACAGLVLGLWPRAGAESFTAGAAAAVLGAQAPVSLALWHGLTLPLGLSVVSVAAGTALAFAAPRLQRSAAALAPIVALGPSSWYTWLLDGLGALASGSTRVLQNGYLRYYLMAILGTTLVLVVPLLASGGLPAWPAEPVGLRVSDVAVVTLIVAAALVTVLTRSRLAAITSLGTIGIGIALVYVMYGAPDLAITQTLVEALTVIVFVLVISRLPRFAVLSSPRARARDAVLAVAAGAMMTALVLASQLVAPASRVSEFFVARSQPEAHGRNIVNVILVDFRGFDTLGEITVLAVAGIGVYALLRLRLGDPQRVD